MRGAFGVVIFWLFVIGMYFAPKESVQFIGLALLFLAISTAIWVVVENW